MQKQKMTLAEKSWIMYDVGNSALVLLATSLIPIYFRSLATTDVVAQWSFAETVASLIIALLMPILGSIADMQGMKKWFIIGTVGTGAVACMGMGIPTHALAFLIVYITASVMLNSSMVFYDALLIDATTDERMDEISSHGYAWGYIGSVVPFLASIGLVLSRDHIGLGLQQAMQIVFIITALWWVAFTIPLLKNVKQIHFKPLVKNPIGHAVRNISKTLVDIWQNRPLRYFIIAYFFYIDGVHTVIKLSTSYGAELGISGNQLIYALLATQVVAFPSAIIYGKLSRKFGTRTMLLIAIAAYLFIAVFAALFMRSALEFWILAMLVGIFQGGIQALSRSEFGKFCPKDRANEYFGFFNIFGKYATILGTFLVGAFTLLTGQSWIGVLSVAMLFVLGFVIMLKMPQTTPAQ